MKFFLYDTLISSKEHLRDIYKENISHSTKRGSGNKTIFIRREILKRLKLWVCCILGLFLICNLDVGWNLTGGLLEEWDTSPLRPYDIEVLSDGTAWLTFFEMALDVGKVFTIDPTDGSTTEFDAPFAARFQTLDRAADDTLWIADNLGRIVHFNPLSGTFSPFSLDPAVFNLSAYPIGIRVAPDGSVWFTCWGDNCIGRFDPDAGTWQRFPSDLADELPDPPIQIVFDDDGMTWFTIRRDVGISPGLGKLDPASGLITIWTEPSLLSPYGIQVVDSMVWFLDHHTNRLVRFNPATETFTSFSTLPDLEDPHFFVVDPDGIFWLTAFVSSAIGTFDPNTETFDSIVLSDPLAHPMGISLSPSGAVWWAETFRSDHGGVGRFIPNRQPDSTGAYANPDCLLPPNHKFFDITIMGVTDPDGDEISIIITSITSDEPTASDNSSGGSKHAPDAYGIGTDTASVRAERSGRGDGRVYVIEFIAIDGRGGESIGRVEVKVPHDKSFRDCLAIDSGQIYDATEIN